MIINRMITNLCSSNIQDSKVFYTSLFDFNVIFDSDWFVNLASEQVGLEIGIIQADHALVPKDYQGKPNGMYLSLVVDDVEEIYQKAQQLGLEIVQAPELTFYGQNRLLLKDPGGVLVDVSSPEGNQS